MGKVIAMKGGSQFLGGEGVKWEEDTLDLKPRDRAGVTRLGCKKTAYA